MTGDTGFDKKVQRKVHKLELPDIACEYGFVESKLYQISF